MKRFLNAVGIGFLAAGTAAVVWYILTAWTQEKRILTPIPQEHPLQIIYPTKTEYKLE
jgi:hypothetical protein